MFPLPLKKYWFILIYARPGNCKSLEQAHLTWEIFNEYHFSERKYKLRKRFVYTNQILNKEFAKKEIEHGHLIYWEDVDDLRYCPLKEKCDKHLVDGFPSEHRLHDCDLMIDEATTLFPADSYKEAPKWLRKTWSQHRHFGLRIVMLTQDFKAVDIHIRRMVWRAYAMRKLIGSRDISPTLPKLWKWSLMNFLNPKKEVIWGMYYRRPIDPSLIEADDKVQVIMAVSKKEKKKLQKLQMVGFPALRFIRWKFVNMFDTTQDVKEVSAQREVEHVEVNCKKENCGYKHVYHNLK